MTDNPYMAHIMEKGYTEQEIRQSMSPAPKKVFPCTIGLRTYNTQEEYDEALADFLNGY